MFTIGSDPQAIFKTHNTGSKALIVSNFSLLLANFGFGGSFIYLPDKQHLSLTKHLYLPCKCTAHVLQKCDTFCSSKSESKISVKLSFLI